MGELIRLAERRQARRAGARRGEASLRGEFEGRGVQFVASDREAFRRALAPLYERYEEVWGRGVFAALQAL